MARAVTSGELTLLRTDHQRSKLFLAIFKPSTVYTARVNQSTFGDPVTEITYDGGSGTLGNVLVGMTLLVGSSAGDDDLGKVYIRKAPSATVFYINPTSEIDWDDNLYLTVLDDFELRAKQPSVSGTTLLIDWDVEYSDQHDEFDPVAVMGPHAVLKLTGSTVNFTPDGSDSWVSGSTISTYAWLAPGASATANLDTDSPTITYNTVGWYRVALTVTDANGKTGTGYRRVFVYDDDNLPVEDFELVKCIADHENGGWEFEVTLFDEADIADVFPGALCLLYAEDWYGSTAGSIGPLAGYENLICMGRIDGEKLDYDGQLGTVGFVVNGPQGWMKKITSSPATFTAADDTASTWSEFASPTVDKALFHLLHWRTNATQIMDIFLSGDTRRLPEIELPINYLWQQVEDLGERRMLASACCDRFGRLFVEIPGQYLETADRSGIPTVMAITKDDWTGRINIEYRCPQVGLAELAGLLDDTPEVVIMSRAPGIVPKREGSFESWDGLVFDNQDHANALSGLFLARENNPYPFVDINLAQNNRMMDVCPNQYVTLSVLAADNPRGIVWTDKKLIVRRIEYQHNADVGSLMSVLECEANTDGPAGVTFIPPQPVEENIDPGDYNPGDYPIFPEPDINFPPYVPTPPPGDDLCLERGNGPYRLIFSPSNIVSSDIESERVSKGYFPCNIRDTGFFPTRLELSGAFYRWNEIYNSWQLITEGDESGWYTIDAIDSGGGVVASANSIAQQTATLRIITFGVGGNANIWGIRITIDEGVEQGFQIGDGISSGSVNGTSTDGVTITSSAVIGQWYTVICSGGPVVLRTEGIGTSYIGQVDFGSGWKRTGGYTSEIDSSVHNPESDPAFSYAYRVGNYMRVFFKATSTTIKFRFNDDIYGDNSGTLGYSLSNATFGEGYKMVGLSGSLYNICPTL